MTDNQFLAKFEKRQLDRSEWTHEAHVRMAWLYVTKTESYRDARSKVRTGIKKLNAAFLAVARLWANRPNLLRKRSRSGSTKRSRRRSSADRAGSAAAETLPTASATPTLRPQASAVVHTAGAALLDE